MGELHPQRIGPSFTTSALILMFVLCSTLAAQETGVLTGTMSDPQGARISNSAITLRWNYIGNRMSWNGRKPPREKRPRKKFLEVITDGAGQFSIKLLSGNWDVLAYRDGFAPTCAIVIVEAGKTANIDLRFPQMAPMPVQ